MIIRRFTAFLAAAALVGIMVLFFHEIIPFPLFRQSPNSPEIETSIEIDEPAHDFGDVLQSVSELAHDFRVTNRGDSAVRLRVRSVGCSCLDLECPEFLSAGATADCTARVQIGGREGPFEIMGMIETSEPGNPTVPILVRFASVPNVRFDPPQIEFHDVRSSAVLTSEFSVIMAMDSEIASENSARVASCTDGVRCSPIGSTEPLGLSNRLKRRIERFRIDIDSSRLSKSGDRALLPAAVVFDCLEGRQRVSRPLRIAVNFRSHDHLAGPKTIALRRGRNSSQSIALESLDHEPFAITGIHVSDPLLHAEFLKQQDALKQEFALKVSAPAPGFAEDPEGESIRKLTVAVTTDRWPEKPYRFEALLLP
ncbi:MAG: DUF1573 domain-containing protein [Planctomycetaceae bacterium]